MSNKDKTIKERKDFETENEYINYILYTTATVVPDATNDKPTEVTKKEILDVIDRCIQGKK